jgi:hypothetical protein
MERKRGNPNWGKPAPFGLFIPTITEFEHKAREFKLKPDQYLGSQLLHNWVERYRHAHYVPESLLKAWGFEDAS